MNSTNPPAPLKDLEQVADETWQAECPGLVPIGEELYLIIRHWRREILENRMWWLAASTTGSSEMRREIIAHRRIARAASVAGPALTTRAIEDEDESIAGDWDPEYRRVFFEGTAEEQDALQARWTEETHALWDAQAKERQSESQDGPPTSEESSTH